MVSCGDGGNARKDVQAARREPSCGEQGDTHWPWREVSGLGGLYDLSAQHLGRMEVACTQDVGLMFRGGSPLSFGGSWTVLQKRQPLSWALEFDLVGSKGKAFPAEGTASRRAWRQAHVKFHRAKGSWRVR